MAISSSILAWEVPWTEEPIVHGVIKQSDTAEPLNHHQVILHSSSLLGKMLAPLV